MYRVVKEPGNTENVFLQNAETMAEVNLGRATVAMMDILEESGYKFSSLHPSDDLAECVTIKEKWNLTITEEGEQ